MKDWVPLCRSVFNPCIPHTEQRQGKSSAYGTEVFPLSVSAIRTRQETRRLPPQTARGRHLRAFFTQAGSAALHHLPAGELRTERHTRPASADHGSPEGEAQRYFPELTNPAGRAFIENPIHCWLRVVRHHGRHPKQFTRGDLNPADGSLCSTILRWGFLAAPGRLGR